MTPQLSRRIVLLVPVVCLLFSTPIPLVGQSGAKSGDPSTSSGSSRATSRGEWRSYGGDLGSTRYAPLDRINASNFNTLEVAWRFKDHNLGPRPEFQYKKARRSWPTASSTGAGRVTGLPAGSTVLLSEHAVLALLQYLFEPQLVLWVDNPSPTKPGTYRVVSFRQPGMVAISRSGMIGIGEAAWTPAYFKRQKPVPMQTLRKRGRPRKIHTLPWPLPMS